MKIKAAIALFVCGLPAIGLGQLSDEERGFAHSFISHYETNITGKFTHEYHPYLLERTTKSLGALEDRLKQEGLNPVGRLMLMGYEEQGVPRYTTNYEDALFTDEMVLKTDAGWSMQMFNRFGLLTGFLCKDINKLSRIAKKKRGAALPMTHIDAHQVEIFDGKRTIFQEHAFGEAFPLVMDMHTCLQPMLVRNDMKAVCNTFIQYWKKMYCGSLKITGREHVVGTQDILFSIAYMQHLKASKLPLSHFYIGPDITYPIEVTTAHSRAVTRHAQSFVSSFVTKLVPRDDKKTAYVFCSFVDGVGKSTMLGNVQNWMKHGSQVEKYEHVDNSSSQLATIFNYSDKVCIADLPAQVSHFTYKPDGLVYVDSAASCLSQEQCHEVQAYVAQHQRELKEQFATMMKQVASSDAAQDESSEHAYCRNVVLLNKQDTAWPAFAFKGHSYVFCPHEKDGGHSIRVLEELETVSSHGLKNTFPEQMIFTKGVRFPLAYEDFVDDLVARLKQSGVERVVMVDFASMYSRSSRENVRVNYVVQQLALLHDSFSLNKSFYQNFVHNAQLLAAMDKKGDREIFARNLESEAIARTGLFMLLQKHSDFSIEGISLAQVTAQLKNYIEALCAEEKTFFARLVEKKIAFEYDCLVKGYGKGREYVTFQQYNPNDLIAFSQKLVSFFSQTVAHERISTMWKWFEKKDPLIRSSVEVDQKTGRMFGRLTSGRHVWVLCAMKKEEKERETLRSVMRQVRAMWWASLSNIIYTDGTLSDGRCKIIEKFAVPPVVAMDADDGSFCVVQPQLEEVEDKEYVQTDYSVFEITPSLQEPIWEAFKGVLYLSDWRGVRQTYQGVYAYAHEWYQEDQVKMSTYESHVKPLVTTLCETYQAECGKQSVMVPEDIMSRMDEQADLAQLIWSQMSAQAKENGGFAPTTKAPQKIMRNRYGEFDQETRVKIYFSLSDQYKNLRFFVRALATLDMIAKDFDADIASRRGNRQDFLKTLALLERITLPYNYGCMCINPLFTDPYAIEPLMGWGYFEKGV